MTEGAPDGDMCAKTYQLQTKAVIWTRLLFGLVVLLCCLGVLMMVCWTWGSFAYEAEAVQKSKCAPAENLGNIMLAKPSKDRRWNIVLLSDREDFMYQRSLASTDGALLTGRGVAQRPGLRLLRRRFPLCHVRRGPCIRRVLAGGGGLGA